MKLSSYSNNRDFCLTIYQCMDTMINDYEPLMLTKFKYRRMKVLPSKIFSTKQIPLSDYGDDQLSYLQK